MDLVTFTEGILNGKLHFLRNGVSAALKKSSNLYYSTFRID